MREAVDQLEQALIRLDRPEVARILGGALKTMTPIRFAGEVVAPALERIGRGWQRGDIALSQIYIGSRICEELIDTILPPAAPERIDRPKVAITVLRDYHLLGKRIVAAHLRSAGFEILDFGRTTVEELLDRVLTDDVKVLLISALMYSSALSVKQVRAGLDSRHADVRIVVGGAPFLMDQHLWREVGADVMGLDAMEAASLVRQMFASLE